MPQRALRDDFPRLRFGTVLSLFVCGALSLGHAGEWSKALHAEEPSKLTETAKTAVAVPAIDLSGLLKSDAPHSVDDLKWLEKAMQQVLPKLAAASVAVQVGSASGSGVIIDKEGHVLTAAHVVGEANKDVLFILPDGKLLKGKTLGANHDLDAGLMQITEQAEFPYLDMGDYEKVKAGTWCLSIGHPGGFQKGRSPVVRFGRVLSARKSLVSTDCTIMPGDSGGPLFDLEGKVIGIHSRIGGALTANIHVPISAYRDDWERLLKGEVWGRDADAGGPYLGVIGDTEAKDQAKLAQVNPNSPADRAGLKPGDVIVKMNEQEIASFDDLSAEVRKIRPGRQITLGVKRGEETLEIKVRIGSRPGG